MAAVKRKAAASSKDIGSVKRHKSAHVSLEEPNNKHRIAAKIEDKNTTELLAFISELVVQQQILETHLPLHVTGAKNNWLKLEAQQFCFEVWWHEDKREGLRETMIHRILRKRKIPHLIVADLDFEFKGVKYLLRQIKHEEISLSDYIRNFNANNNLSLTIKQLKHAVQSLYDLANALRRDHYVFTIYTAANTIITIIDEDEIRFCYKVTDEFNLMIPTDIGSSYYSFLFSGGIGEQRYFRGREDPSNRTYDLFHSIATAAKMIGASAQLVNLIRNIPTRRSKIANIMKCDEDIQSDVYWKGPIVDCPLGQSVKYEPRPELPEYTTINDVTLQYVSEQVMKNMVLSEKPIFIVKDDVEWCQRLEDQHGHCFEVIWYDDIEEGQVTAMVHKTMREAKVPHLLTADFGFEYGGFYATVRQYDPKLTPFCRTIRENNQTVHVIVPRDELSESRPVALTNNCFSASEMWLLPDGRGSCDFKYLISFCGAMKLADDGVGVIAYGKITEGSFNLLWPIVTATEDLKDKKKLFEDLDPASPSFAEEMEKIITILGNGIL